MTSATYDYVIVGGGVAAASAVAGIRSGDASGTIAVFGSEPDKPVYRPVLSKDLWLKDDETLEGALADWQAAADRTDALVRSVDLDETHPLPQAPWFAPGEVWSNRPVFMHVLAETAQHAGHADIIRESIDGQKTMA